MNKNKSLPQLQNAHKLNIFIYNRDDGLWYEWHGGKSCTRKLYSAGESECRKTLAVWVLFHISI